MSLRQTFFCFFFLSVKNGGTAAFEENIGVRTGVEGGTIKVECTFIFSGSRRVFCRDNCGKGDILVETSGISNHRGRYSIKYEESNFSSMITVSITDLKKSDSGRYKCWLDRDFSLDSYEKFELRVTDAPTTTKPNWTPGHFSASTSVTRTTSTLSSTSTSPRTSKPSPQITNGTEKQSSSGPDRLLYLSLLLVLLIVIFSMILLIYCKKRARKPKAKATGPSDKTKHPEVSESNRIYEEIREDDPNKSPPKGISTVYTCAKFSQPHDAQTTNEYSLVGPQAGDDSSKLTYSTVDFSNTPAAPHNSAPSERVIYSVPRVDASAEDALYSTVSLH